MIDFPNNPAVGDAFTSGGTIFRCEQINPAVWTASPVDAGIPDAPVDGLTYGRSMAAWTQIPTLAQLNGKEPTIAVGVAGQWWRYDKTWQPIAVADVQGLQTALNNKEPSLAAGTPLQYYRGDKTWQTLSSTAVGLPAVLNNQQIINLRPTPNSDSHLIYIGYYGGLLDCQVDSTYFGGTWPINISGTAASAPANGGNSTTVSGGSPDRSANWGFASGNYNLPYMRLDNSSNIRYLVYNTNNDNTVQGLRLYASSPYTFEIVGSLGAFGITANPSDIRLKCNIKPSVVDASAIVQQMEFIGFNFIADQTDYIDLGFSAQNLQSLDKRMVTAIPQPEGSPMASLGEVLNLNDGAIIAYLAKSLQEALQRIDSLEGLVKLE